MGIPAPVLRSLHDLVGRLDRGLTSDADADEFLSLACRAFSSACGAIVQGTTFAPWGRQSGIPPSWPPLHDRYAHQDFALAATLAAPVGTCYLMQQHLTVANRETDIHAGFLSSGLRDCALVRVYAPQADDLGVVFYRADDQPPFSEEDRTLFDLLYPRIAGAFAARRALALVRERSMPHVFLSLPSRLVSWTEPARRIWRRRLGTIGADGWRRIERALFLAASRFRDRRDGGRSQLVRADLRLELAFVPPGFGEEQRVLILFQEEKTAPQRATGAPVLPAEMLLSPVQLAIARATAGGWPAPTIARARGISEETVRTHIKEIYRRLGVSRAELSTLVAPEHRPRRG